MLKLRFLLTFFSTALGLAAGAFADTIVLKSGEKINGRILSETDAQVTVEVQVSASIKDEQVIKKANIEKIEKVLPDVVAWPNVKALALGKESFEQADYIRAEAVLNNFLTSFPDSSHAAEAKAKLAEFSGERKRVANGEVKLDGAWLTKEKVEEEAVQIGGRVLYSRMSRLAAAGQFIEAMNVYDALEKTYPGSAAIPDAILLARQVVPRIQATVVQMKERVKAQAEENKRRLATAQGNEREQLATLLRNEAENAKAVAASAERSGVKWIPIVAVESSLNVLGSKASSEASSLGNKPVDKMKESIALAEDARKALEAKDFAAAEKAISKSQSAWSNYEVPKRLQQKLAQLKKDAEANKAAEAAAAVAAAKVESDREKAAKLLKPAPAPTPEQPVVETAPKGDDTPFYAKPILWVILIVGGLFGTLGVKAYHKFRDPNRNLLDQ